MTCTFEWLCSTAAILRLHEADTAKYGDPYVWWTVGVIKSGGTLELKGADRPLPTGGPQALCAAARAAGFKRRVHQRIVGDRVRTVEKEL